VVAVEVSDGVRGKRENRSREWDEHCSEEGVVESLNYNIKYEGE